MAADPNHGFSQSSPRFSKDICNASTLLIQACLNDSQVSSPYLELRISPGREDSVTPVKPCVVESACSIEVDGLRRIDLYGNGVRQEK